MEMCVLCGKRQGTNYIYKRVNNQVTRLLICNECASKDREITSLINSVPMFSSVFSNAAPNDIFSAVAGMFAPKQANALVCRKCNTCVDDFIKSGFLGCPDCYKTFEQPIMNAVKQIQQADHHTGKTPSGGYQANDSKPQNRADNQSKANKNEQEINRLNKLMQAAVTQKDYEKAGELLEQIRKITGSKN